MSRKSKDRRNQRGPLTPKRRPSPSASSGTFGMSPELAAFMGSGGAGHFVQGGPDGQVVKAFKRPPSAPLQHEPDFKDPFGPADRDPAQPLRCLHCEREFTVADVKWEPSNGGIWVCPSWPECDGGGIGFDLVEPDPGPPDVTPQPPAV